MSKPERKRCKSKECNNLVIVGKYCEYCTKKRKEKQNMFVKAICGIGAVFIAAAMTVYKTIKFFTKR